MVALTGKVAIVTASSRGIGAAVAHRLGRDGAAVVVNYVASPEKAEAVVTAIKAQGGQAIAVQGSVAKKADVTRLFDQAEQQFGSIDIVVNVAGASVFKPHTELTDEDFEKVFSVNARGAMYMLQAAAKRIADGGRIVQFSTGGTVMPIFGGGIYAASKAAGERFAFALAKEVGNRQITVNVVSPGVTDTDGLIMSDEQVAPLIQQTPLGRLGQPTDIADVVAFLVSDDAHWMTGQNLQVNGGIL
ncbi:SDR family oxidoreductase [filamentous cyanobacterium LEGE 11480]|uniref:SDR family oxidoreductase n=1 Tax=Romeriopsis navalis LEGE 11480 TaxID=2777977 RepID=A0A928VVL2_9CYAN|nr:SDR family oxidoreductase [Romeriopsis navalis]MBE9033292.1 SDR family oxidoreductase [Romeriopsis navalis LEGE 11480]